MLAAWVQTVIDPGEREIASLPFGFLTTSLLANAVRILTAPVGWVTAVGYSLVVTDARVMVARNIRGKHILEATYPRRAVTATYDHSLLRGRRFTLTLPDGAPLRLQVGFIWDTAAREVVASLSPGANLTQKSHDIPER